MNKRKLKEKNLARIVEWLTTPDIYVSALPNKIRKEIGKRYTSKYLGKKWRDIEQQAFELGLFRYKELEEEAFILTAKGLKLIIKYYKSTR
jgi:hypothetical protein